MPLVIILSLFLTLVWGPPVSAQDSASLTLSPFLRNLQKPELDERDLNEIYQRKLDDPQGLLRELFAAWGRVDSDSVPSFQARLGWLITLTWSDDFRESPSWDIEEVHRKTITLAEAGHFSGLLPELRFRAFEYKNLDGASDYAQNSEQLWALTRTIQEPQARAYALLLTATRLIERGVSDELFLRSLKEARELLPSQNIEVTPRNFESLDLLNIVLRSLGQAQEAEFLSKKLESYCDRYNLRYICSGRLYEKGMELIRTHEQDRSPQAIPLFMKSIDLARQIRDDKQVAVSQYGLMVAYNFLGDFRKAIDYGALAITFYEAQGPRDWAATVWNELSIAYLGNKDLTKALDAVQKGLQNCAPEFKNDRKKIFHQLSKVHQARKEFEKALLYQTLYIELENETRTDESKKEYSKFRNEALMKENELLGQQIQLLGKFRIVSLLAAGLACIIFLAFIVVWRQSKELGKSRKTMKDVLDHIDEGIAILDRSLSIKAGYSRYLDILFRRENQSLVGETFLDLLFRESKLGTDVQALTREVLTACMGEPELSWELNHSHLPRELTREDRVLALHWQPIVNQAHMIAGFLVSLRDITELRAIEKKMQMESKRVQQIQLKMEEVLAGKITHIRKFVNGMSEDWSQMQGLITHDRPEARRRLHSWKGGSRTLGLKLLASSIHEMESSLAESTSSDLPSAESCWDDLSLTFFDYHHLLNKVMVSHGEELSSAEDLYNYAFFYAQDIRNRLSAVGIPYEGVLVLDSVHKWKKDVLPKIHDMLVHAVSNAIDHGFIRPSQSQVIKNPARIVIKSFCEDNRVKLQVQDNGAGINWDALQRKADEIGFIPKAGQSLVDLLYRDGVSTAESTSQTSGRGVGLSVIHSLCQELGGHITLESPNTGGTALLMEFPAGRVLDAGNLKDVA